MISGELLEGETLVSLLIPIQGRKDEFKFIEWINQFNPFYYHYINGDEVLICF